MNEHERGLGLDLSTVKTGWFTCTGDTLTGGRLILPGVGTEGIFSMAHEVKMAIRGYEPEWVAIEDIYIHPNAKFANPHTFKELAGLQFAVTELCWTIGVPYYLGHAASIDAACGIKGFQKRAARKKDVQAFAQQLGWVVPEDVADALAVLFWGMGIRRRELMVQEAENDISKRN